MNIENLKSILLTILVGVSFVLTWRLWTYYPNYNFISTDKVVQEVSIGSKKEIGAIVEPKQIIYHKNNRNYISDELSNINLIYKEIQKGEIDDLADISDVLSNDEFLQLVHGQNKIEIVFPTKVPIQQLMQLFQINEKSVGNIEADRIILDMRRKDNKELTIYLVNYSDKYVYKGTLKNSNISTMETICSEQLIQFPLHFSYKINNQRIIYLPYDSFEKTKESYIINQLNPEVLKNALFTDPEYVKRDTSTSGESYMDGTRILKIYYQHQLINYVNPAISSNQHSTSGPLVQKSIDFINNHSGWTAPYRFFYWNGFKGETSFRLFMNNMPVFNRDGLASIYQKWGEEDIIEYSRALFKINSKVESRSQRVWMLPGEEVRAIIKNTPDANSDLIKDIYIGYEMSIANTNNNYIYLEPVWIIDYGDSYKKIVVNESGKGGEIVGLESN